MTTFDIIYHIFWAYWIIFVLGGTTGACTIVGIYHYFKRKKLGLKNYEWDQELHKYDSNGKPTNTPQ